MALQASVIIPTYNDWDTLQTCLDCLAEQTVGLDRFEVIVANNNADPGPPPGLRLPANARVLHVPRPGSYAARNVAVSEARADILFFTDSDCQPAPDWIAVGLAAIQPLGPHGRVAGRVELFAPGGIWNGPALYDRLFGLQQVRYAGGGWGATANLVVRRACFDLAGPFSDDRMSGGDRQWGTHAHSLGAEIVYSPETLVRHPARSSFAELAKKRRRLAGGRHYEEVRGMTYFIPLRAYLTGMPLRKYREACFTPGYTEGERLLIIWVGVRLGWIEMLETARLRYFAGEAKRS
jgi:glycosyltransferase involved in cell wall biosynthesis